MLVAGASVAMVTPAISTTTVCISVTVVVPLMLLAFIMASVPSTAGKPVMLKAVVNEELVVVLLALRL